MTNLKGVLAFGAGLEPTLTVQVGPVACMATVPPVALSLEAGRWRITTTMGFEPEESAPPPVESVRTVDLAAGGDVVTDPLSLRVYRPLDEAGRVTCGLIVERKTEGGWERFASGGAEVVLDAVRPTEHLPRFGANLHIYIPRDRPPGSLDPFLDQMASIGMEVVRTSIPWSLLCPDSAAFDPTALAQADAFFSGLASRSMKAIPIVDAHSPSWAQGDRQDVPESWDGYADYVRACLDRWGSTFAAILTQNEPNHAGHVNEFEPELVVAAARAARSAVASSQHADSVRVLGPGIAFGDVNYLNMLLDAGLGETVDGIACHPYGIRFDVDPPHFQAPEKPWGDPAGDPCHLASGVEAMRQALLARGYDLSIWVNEYGLSTSRTGPDGTLGGLDVTEEVQASWLATAVRQAAATPYLESFCIYMFHDNPWRTVEVVSGGAEDEGDEAADNNWQARFGLVSWNGRREKPALRAVADAILAANLAAVAVRR